MKLHWTVRVDSNFSLTFFGASIRRIYHREIALFIWRIEASVQKHDGNTDKALFSGAIRVLLTSCFRGQERRHEFQSFFRFRLLLLLQDVKTYYYFNNSSLLGFIVSKFSHTILIVFGCETFSAPASRPHQLWPMRLPTLAERFSFALILDYIRSSMCSRACNTSLAPRICSQCISGFWTRHFSITTHP